MSKYIKSFETTPEYEEYIQGGGVILPNVSMAKDAPTMMYYTPYVPPQPITYTASVKLTETTSNWTAGLHTNAFNKTIKSHTFENGVGTIEFDGDITSIGNNAFYKCSGLTSITIPDSVTSIGENAFNGCTGLTSVTIPDNVTSIGENAFYSCTSLTSINIPNNIEIINASVFKFCRHLTSITIPDNVTSIGQNAFQSTGLTSVTIPDSVTTISSNAFGSCSDLTSVTIGSGVTSILEEAFYLCWRLPSITCNATSAPRITSSTFKEIKMGGTLTVPSGSTGYDVWMGTGDYYLGKYNWTKVEQ